MIYGLIDRGNARQATARRAAYPLLAMMLVLTACSDTAETTRASFAEEFSVAAALDELPAMLETGDQDDVAVDYATYRATSYHGLAEAAGLTPVESGDLIAFTELGARTGHISGQNCATSQESNADYPAYGVYSQFLTLAILDEDQELGSSWTGVESTATASALSEPTFTIATGVSVRDDLQEVAPGVVTLGTGADFDNNVAERTLLRSLGNPLRIGNRVDAVAVSELTSPVEEWINGGHAVPASTNASLLAVAQQLDGYGVLSAELIDQHHNNGMSTRLAEALAVGWGWGTDDKGMFGIFAAAYADADTAQRHLVPISDWFGDSTDPISIADVGLLGGGDFATVESVELVGAEIVALVRFEHNVCANHLQRLWVLRGLES